MSQDTVENFAKLVLKNLSNNGFPLKKVSLLNAFTDYYFDLCLQIEMLSRKLTINHLQSISSTSNFFVTNHKTEVFIG